MAETYKQVGIDYCRLHFGTRNEDDNYRDDDGNLACDQRDDDETTPCVLAPLVFKVPPPPSPYRSVPALLHAMFNQPSEADIAAMKKALAYYDRQVEMGAVPSPFSGDAARAIVAYALGMLGEYLPTTDGVVIGRQFQDGAS